MPKRSRNLTLSAAASFVLIFAGCGSTGGVDAAGTDTTVAETPSTNEMPDMDAMTFVDFTGLPEVVVNAVDNDFKPANIEISAGTKVTFRNDGRNPHNVLPVEADAFEEIPTEDFQPGDEGMILFADAGDFPYFCSLHGTSTKGMANAIRVVP